MATDRELVFVYGTLCVGASNHHRMRGAEWVGTAWVTGRLYQVSWYPGFILDAEGGRVVGEVYRVSPEHLARLDEFEGIPEGERIGEEYERRRIPVKLSNAARAWSDDKQEDAWKWAWEMDAWVWVWRKSVEDLTEVSTGDWLDIERPRQSAWFTTVGCVGVLGVPIVGSLLIGFLRSHVSVVLPSWVYGAFLMCGAGTFFVLGILAHRRRERGMPLQVLLLSAAFLIFFGGMLLFLSSF